MDSSLLTLMTFVPLAGIPLLFFTNDVKAQRWIATAVSAIAMVLSILVFTGLQKSGVDAVFGASPYHVKANWIDVGNIHIKYAMDVDALSAFMVLLTRRVGARPPVDPTRRRRWRDAEASRLHGKDLR